MLWGTCTTLCLFEYRLCARWLLQGALFCCTNRTEIRSLTVVLERLQNLPLQVRPEEHGDLLQGDLWETEREREISLSWKVRQLCIMKIKRERVRYWRCKTKNVCSLRIDVLVDTPKTYKTFKTINSHCFDYYIIKIDTICPGAPFKNT